MELKTARLTLLIDPNKKAAFERLCALQDRTASQVVRQLIRDYLAEHGVDYTATGPEEEPAQSTERTRSTAKRPQPKSTAAAGSRTGRRRG
ncbi:ribbon-helix-helix protein, CopG family [Methylibium sp.]|uniref:ribbon-helix-helix protein, CopG family n=1 Tax=Methylibium sp. TaxID=2067992 RepID=UPI003D0EBA6F